MQLFTRSDEKWVYWDLKFAFQSPQDLQDKIDLIYEGDPARASSIIFAAYREGGKTKFRYTAHLSTSFRFSYKTADFLSENCRVQRALRPRAGFFRAENCAFRRFRPGGPEELRSFGERRVHHRGQTRGSAGGSIQTIAWIVGRPNFCKTWWTAFPGKSPLKSLSSTPDELTLPPSN